MAFNSNTPRNEYTASSGQTIFPFDFQVFNNTDLVIYLTPNGQSADDTADLLTLTTDYTVTIIGESGGSITLTSAATSGDAVTITRSLPIDRDTEYQERGDLRASTLNDDQDYQTQLINDISARNSRVVTLPESSQGLSGILPNPSAENYLRWNTNGTALENDLTAPTYVTETKQYRDEAEASASNASTSEDNAKASEDAAKISEDNAAASVASINPTNLLHTQGNGGGNPEGYTSTEVDNLLDAKSSISTTTSNVMTDGTLAISSSNINITSGVFTYTDGKNNYGYNRKSDTFTGSVDFSGATDGLKWVGKDLDANTFNFLDKKPSVGLYDKTSADDNRYVFDTASGKWYTTTGGELVTNGTFDTDKSGFIALDGCSLTWVSGVLRATRTSDTGSRAFTFDVATEIGNEYILTGNNPVGNLNDISIYINDVLIKYSVTVIDIKFIPDVISTTVKIFISGSIGQYFDFDNISVYKKQATLGTPIATPLSFLPNPIQVTSGTPQSIDYSDELATNVMDSLSVCKLSVTDGFDLGQTWQDMTSSRALGVTYTNTTNRPIMIIVETGAASGSVTRTLYIDGAVAIAIEGNYSDQVIYGIIPNNSTYKVTSNVLERWSELR